MAKKHHRRRSHTLGNPMSISGVSRTAKQLISKENTTAVFGIGVGFVVSNLVVAKLPATWKDSMPKAFVVKAGAVVITTLVSGMVSKRIQKYVLYGGGFALFLDLYTDFVAPWLSSMGAGAPASSGTNQFFGAGPTGTRRGTALYFGKKNGVGRIPSPMMMPDSSGM